MVSNQPVVVGFHVEDGDHSLFQRYIGGLVTQAFCSTNQLNHAVLVVGFDVGTCNKKLPNGNPDITSGCKGGYWLVRNSWGVNWGIAVSILSAVILCITPH